MVSPYTVVPGTVAGGSILLHPSVRPYTVGPRTVGKPDWDAQRFYFRAATVAEVSPAFDAAWDVTTDAERHALVTSIQDDAAIVNGTTRSWTAGQTRLDRQYVGPMLRGGVSFTGATVQAILAGLELAADDNVIGYIGLRICSADGSVIRATLLDVGHYGNSTEFIASPSSALGRSFANANTALAAYTTQPGDRPVVEVGTSDVSGTTPQAAIYYGNVSALGDQGVNGGLPRRPWLEITPAAA